MRSVYGIAQSGLQDAALRISVSAHNSANANSDGFVPGRVISAESTQGGVSSRVVPQANTGFDAMIDNVLVRLSGTNAADEAVNTMVAVAAFKANLASMRTAELLDEDIIRIKT